MNRKQEWKMVWENEWFLWKLCWKTTPLYMAILVFECIRFDIFIFLEHTLGIWYVLECAETKQPFSKILTAMLGLIGLLMISHLIQSIYHQWSLPKMKPILYKALREQIYEKAVKQDLANYDDPAFYNDFILATSEANKCIDRFLDVTGPGISTITGFVLQFIFLGIVDAGSYAFAIAAMLFTLFSMNRLNRLEVSRRLERNEPERKRKYVHRVFYLYDYAKELRLNKEFSPVLMESFEEANDELQKVNNNYASKLWFWNFMSQYGRSIIMDGLYTALLVYQAIFLRRFHLSMVVTLSNSAKRLSGNGVRLVRFYPRLVENSIFVDKIKIFMKMEPKIRSEKNLPSPEISAVLKLEHVSFAYGMRNSGDVNWVLRDINMEIRPGHKIALVGYNGAGKSTLVKLIMRLYDPVEGRILLNGVDIRNFEPEAYRRYIGVVFQDFRIYAATVKENVVMDLCEENPSEDAAVKKALLTAGFTADDQRIKYELEVCLTTEFDKEGVNLSGGEGQKVAIARALYREQNLIIMDEPSSALDPLAEYQLNSAMHEIAEDKTLIFISHRLSTTRDADCIYMMENGRIIERGSHRQLLEKKGVYANMWNAQAGKYLLA